MSRSELSDVDLLRAVALREDLALEALYNRFASRLFGIALRLLDRADAEEVLQETFMHAWREGRRYRPDRGSVITWLAMITRSRAIDRRRSRNGQSPVLTPSLQAATAPSSAVTMAEAPLIQLERLTQRRAVSVALGELSADQRTALELAFYQGMTHTEIAASTQSPLGTVKTRIRRGMDRLASALHSELEK